MTHTDDTHDGLLARELNDALRPADGEVPSALFPDAILTQLRQTAPLPTKISAADNTLPVTRRRALRLWLPLAACAAVAACVTLVVVLAPLSSGDTVGRIEPNTAASVAGQSTAQTKPAEQIYGSVGAIGTLPGEETQRREPMDNIVDVPADAGGSLPGVQTNAGAKSTVKATTRKSGKATQTSVQNAAPLGTNAADKTSPTNATASAKPLTPQQLTALLQQGALLMDVREPDEYAAGHIPDAINVPLNGLEEKIGSYARDVTQPLVVYCRSGVRSRQAAAKLRALGYTTVYDLGGIQSWTGSTTF